MACRSITVREAIIACDVLSFAILNETSPISDAFQRQEATLRAEFEHLDIDEAERRVDALEELCDRAVAEVQSRGDRFSRVRAFRASAQALEVCRVEEIEVPEDLALTLLPFVDDIAEAL